MTNGANSPHDKSENLKSFLLNFVRERKKSIRTAPSVEDLKKALDVLRGLCMLNIAEREGKKIYELLKRFLESLSQNEKRHIGDILISVKALSKVRAEIETLKALKDLIEKDVKMFEDDDLNDVLNELKDINNAEELELVDKINERLIRLCSNHDKQGEHTLIELKRMGLIEPKKTMFGEFIGKLQCKLCGREFECPHTKEYLSPPPSKKVVVCPICGVRRTISHPASSG